MTRCLLSSYTARRIDHLRSRAHAMSTTTRRAACSCGQLSLAIEGEPARVSMCHCLECQRRTGAVSSNQARFLREQITFVGQATAWTRSSASGNALTFRFCPVCGSTVYWEGESFPGLVAVAIGTFADPNFPAPAVSVWEETRHSWMPSPADAVTNACRSRAETVIPEFPAGEYPGPRPSMQAQPVAPDARFPRSRHTLDQPCGSIEV